MSVRDGQFMSVPNMAEQPKTHEVDAVAAIKAISSMLMAAIRENKCLEANNQRLRQTIINLLASADCAWEERNEGHDWPGACRRARRVLRVDED